jgi:hypothetical protein
MPSPIQRSAPRRFLPALLALCAAGALAASQACSHDATPTPVQVQVTGIPSLSYQVTINLKEATSGFSNSSDYSALLLWSQLDAGTAPSGLTSPVVLFPDQPVGDDYELSASSSLDGGDLLAMGSLPAFTFVPDAGTLYTVPLLRQLGVSCNPALAATCGGTLVCGTFDAAATSTGFCTRHCATSTASTDCNLPVQTGVKPRCLPLAQPAADNYCQWRCDSADGGVLRCPKDLACVALGDGGSVCEGTAP